MAPQGAQSARQGTQKARKRAQHHRCVGCAQPASARKWDCPSCDAHRRQPKQPLPQGFGAVAAGERDVGAVVSARVPRLLPAAEATERVAARKPVRSDFAHRAPTARCDRRWSSSYRISARAVAAVAADPLGAESNRCQSDPVAVRPGGRNMSRPLTRSRKALPDVTGARMKGTPIGMFDLTCSIEPNQSTSPRGARTTMSWFQGTRRKSSARLLFPPEDLIVTRAPLRINCRHLRGMVMSVTDMAWISV